MTAIKTCTSGKAHAPQLSKFNIRWMGVKVKFHPEYHRWKQLFAQDTLTKMRNLESQPNAEQLQLGCRRACPAALKFYSLMQGGPIAKLIRLPLQQELHVRGADGSRCVETVAEMKLNARIQTD
jgi:hypothetical protein